MFRPRAWLDKEGFVDVFKGWKADAILGKSDEFVRSRFPKALEGQDQAEMLCGLLNTARQSTSASCWFQLQTLFTLIILFASYPYFPAKM